MTRLLFVAVCIAFLVAMALLVNYSITQDNECVAKGGVPYRTLCLDRKAVIP